MSAIARRALTVALPASMILTALGAMTVGPRAEPTDPAAEGLDNAEALSPFFATLDKALNGAAQGPSVIAWYGDSAIVSDGYTRAVRRALQAEAGDAGPGFVLAGLSFDGYLRDGVRMKRSGWKTGSVLQGDVKSGRYGYGGVVGFGTRGASLTLELQGDSKAASPQPATVVEVFAQTGPRGGELGLFIDGAREPIETFSTAADAVGDAVWRVRPKGGATSEVKLKVLGGGARVYGVAVGRDEGVQLDAIGILGIRARRWLNADAGHLAEQVRARAPALLVLNFGGNERVDPGLSAEAHQKDLEQVLDALRAEHREAPCVVVGPLIHGVPGRGGKVLDPALAKLYAGQRAAASTRSCAFIDTIALMGGHTDKTLHTWRKKRWISGDYAHLTPSGHAELGERLARVLLTAWRRPTPPSP